MSCLRRDKHHMFRVLALWSLRQRRTVQIFLLIIALSIIGVVVGYIARDWYLDRQPRVWVAFTPNICYSPWQKWWKDTMSKPGLRRHANEVFAPYPPGGEEEMVRRYYRTQWIRVYLAKFTLVNKFACSDCSCLSPATLYVSIPASQVPKMNRLGFREAQPPD